jgi:DNA-binding response OmpR family regulator
MRILIADDSEFILESLSKLINATNRRNEVFVAKDVEEAITKLDNINPEVLVLDLKMPKGIGFDVLDIAKQKEKPPIVIILTNYDLEQYKKRSFNSGADYFFDKSTEFEKVIDVIEEIDQNLVSKNKGQLK